MAMNLDLDSIDFAAYARDNFPRAKVRRANVYTENLLERLRPKPSLKRSIMASTKLRTLIEFRPGEITVWAGFSGHRKSMFVGQLVLDLCALDEPTLIASMEMLPAETLWRMCRQAAGGIPTDSFIEAFSQWTDGRLWLLDHLGRITTSQCLSMARYFVEKCHGRHIVIDSLLMVVNSEEHLDEQKQLVTDLVRFAQEANVHVHLIAHAKKPATTGEKEPPTKYDVRGSAAITDQAANVITVWLNKAKKAALEIDHTDAKRLQEPDHLVTVEKQRNGPWEGRIKLWFDEASMRFTDERMSTVEPHPAIRDLETRA